MNYRSKLRITIKIIPILFLGLLLSGCFGPAIQVKKDDFTGDTLVTMKLALRSNINNPLSRGVSMEFVRTISGKSEKTKALFSFSTGSTQQNVSKDDFDIKISIDGAISNIVTQSVTSNKHMYTVNKQKESDVVSADTHQKVGTLEYTEKETRTFFTIDGSLSLNSKSTTKLKTASEVKFRFSYNGKIMNVSVDEKQLELLHEFFTTTGEEETK